MAQRKGESSKEQKCCMVSFNYKAPKKLVEFNDMLRGVDVFDRKRSQFSYSLEKFSTCHKWWQKGFMQGSRKSHKFVRLCDFRQPQRTKNWGILRFVRMLMSEASHKIFGVPLASNVQFYFFNC